MRFFATILFSTIAIFSRATNVCQNADAENTCVSFSVTSGTGCAWMCNYCANSLGTNNYYFVDGVCKYQDGGCVGNPQTGVQYTCCSV